LKGETGSDVTAPQDQALQTKYLAIKILQAGTDSNADCAKCDHFISAWKIVAKEQYIKRRDVVCAELHFDIWKEMGDTSDNRQWYDHAPKSVEPSREDKVTVIWNQQVRTDRTIANNKPDIIIRDDTQGTCVLTFRRRIKSCLPFAGIIRRLTYSTHFQDKG